MAERSEKNVGEIDRGIVAASNIAVRGPGTCRGNLRFSSSRTAQITPKAAMTQCARPELDPKGRRRSWKEPEKTKEGTALKFFSRRPPTSRCEEIPVSVSFPVPYLEELGRRAAHQRAKHHGVAARRRRRGRRRGAESARGGRDGSSSARR